MSAALRGLFAALALALACVGEGGDGVSLSGTGGGFFGYRGDDLIELGGGPYSCRAQVSNNTYRNERGEIAGGQARITISGTELAPLEVIDERAAANVTGAARFAVREGLIHVTVVVEPRARWELACEPDARQ